MIHKMNDVIKNLAPAIQQISWQNEEVYAQWLSQAFYIARRSTSYLGLALFHSEKYPDFQSRCTKHIAEETGHEKLIKNDLNRLSQPLGPELPSTSAIYQPQYFRIVAENPLSFLGYVFFLELLAPAYGPYVMERVKNKSAVSFLKVHAKADEDHIEEATKIFSTLPKEIQELALSNFMMTAESYRAMLGDLAVNSRSLKSAA